MKKFTLLFALSMLVPTVSALAQTAPKAGKNYYVISKKTGECISESDGFLVPGTKSKVLEQMWTIETADASIPAYYVKNLKTGNYMQSCNASLDDKIQSGASPIPYYLGLSTSGDNSGYYWLSSTDCNNYSDNSLSPRGLNRSGAVDFVIAWHAGLTNGGSYWSFEEIDQTIVDSLLALEPQTPIEEPEDTIKSDGKTYFLISKQFGDYMADQNGKLVTTSLDQSQPIYWEIIDTNTDIPTYYIRNKVTGKYIQSCNLTKETQVSTGTKPVDYYIGTSASGNNAGYKWLSSVDCDNYRDNTQSPLGLNRHGSKQIVITWDAGLTNNGSYWTLQETPFNYEIKPFTPSAAIGSPTAVYNMQTPKGNYMNGDGTLSEKADGDNATWYFVGSNSGGGYNVVNLATGTPQPTASGADKWIVVENKTNGMTYYSFVASDNTTDTLTIGGENRIFFKLARSVFARHAQIYDLPCGTTSGQYFTKVSLKGEGASKNLTYPIRTQSGTDKASTQQNVVPSKAYSINALDKAKVIAGKEIQIDMTLFKAVSKSDALEVFVYFDWDRDGVFETVEQVIAEKTMQLLHTVPATAKDGRTRMRLRATDNGLSDAEDEVHGQVLDFEVEVTHDDAEFTVTARSNDPTRGSAVIEGDVAVATPYNGATFVCWKEGKRIVATRNTYTFKRDNNVELTAIFAADPNDPFGENVLTGIRKPSTINDQNVLVNVEVGHKKIVAKTAAKILKVNLYSATGALVRQASGNTISTEGLPQGAYILKVFTDKKDKSAKVLVK